MSRIISKLVVFVFAFLIVFDASALAHTDVIVYEAKDMIDSNDELIIVDVREFSEYCTDNGHIPGALNYPWNSGVLRQRYEELPVDAEILVYCQSGYRSNVAAQFLDSKEFLFVYDMVGGFSSWEWETVGCVDSDRDHVNDDLDNCPRIYNPLQTDSDGDQIGNACDSDCPYLDGLNPVDFTDFSILAHNWQLTGPDLEGDLNTDDKVDENDLVIFVEYWLSECSEDLFP